MKRIIAISMMLVFVMLIISACTKTTLQQPVEPTKDSEKTTTTTIENEADEDEFNQPSVDRLDSDFSVFNDW